MLMYEDFYNPWKELDREEIETLLLSKVKNEKHKKIFRLRYFDGLTHKKIAEQVGLKPRSTQTVFSLIGARFTRWYRRIDAAYNELWEREARKLKDERKREEAKQRAEDLKRREIEEEERERPDYLILAFDGTEPYIRIPVDKLRSFKPITPKTYERWLNELLEIRKNKNQQSKDTQNTTIGTQGCGLKDSYCHEAYS